MGKNLKGKELGKGIVQRKDGRYMGRLFQNQETYFRYSTFGAWYEYWFKTYTFHMKDTTLSTYEGHYARGVTAINNR